MTQLQVLGETSRAPGSGFRVRRSLLNPLKVLKTSRAQGYNLKEFRVVSFYSSSSLGALSSESARAKVLKLLALGSGLCRKSFASELGLRV